MGFPPVYFSDIEFTKWLQKSRKNIDAAYQKCVKEDLSEILPDPSAASVSACTIGLAIGFTYFGLDLVKHASYFTARLMQNVGKVFYIIPAGPETTACTQMGCYHIPAHPDITIFTTKADAVVGCGLASAAALVAAYGVHIKLGEAADAYNKSMYTDGHSDNDDDVHGVGKPKLHVSAADAAKATCVSFAYSGVMGCGAYVAFVACGTPIWAKVAATALLVSGVTIGVRAFKRLWNWFWGKGEQDEAIENVKKEKEFYDKGRHKALNDLNNKLVLDTVNEVLDYVGDIELKNMQKKYN